MLLSLLTPFALAADGPSIWGREAVVFENTYGGLGLQAMASPAFVLVGPRLSFAPIDVFDITIKGAHGWYFDNGLGLIPFDRVGGSASAARNLVWAHPSATGGRRGLGPRCVARAGGVRPRRGAARVSAAGLPDAR